MFVFPSWGHKHCQRIINAYAQSIFMENTMKKLLGILALMGIACGFYGCAENGLECSEDSFRDRCIDEGTLEICTYGERARLKCANSCEESGDEEENDQCK